MQSRHLLSLANAIDICMHTHNNWLGTVLYILTCDSKRNVLIAASIVLTIYLAIWLLVIVTRLVSMNIIVCPVTLYRAFTDTV